MRALLWTVGWLALTTTCIVVGVLWIRATTPAPAPSAPPADESAPKPAAAATPAPSVGLPPPHPVRHDSVRVSLGGPAGREASWQMSESAPLVEPDTEARPVTVLFHGTCADSTWTCDWLQYFPMKPQWQVCPRAPRACKNEPGYTWTTPAETRTVVERSLATLKERHGAGVHDDSVVLAGFSLGAYAVAGLVHELATHLPPSLHVKGVLAQGGHARFSAADLRALGARIALAAGDLDAAAPAMRAEAARLNSQGIDARFASLGKDESHFTSVSTGKTIAELIDWCRGD